jgi:hypothetical protein
MSVKKVVGASSPIARRCAFVGHLRNAVNTAAVIELFVSISFGLWSALLSEFGPKSEQKAPSCPQSTKPFEPDLANGLFPTIVR